MLDRQGLAQIRAKSWKVIMTLRNGKDLLVLAQGMVRLPSLLFWALCFGDKQHKIEHWP